MYRRTISGYCQPMQCRGYGIIVGPIQWSTHPQSAIGASFDSSKCIAMGASYRSCQVLCEIGDTGITDIGSGGFRDCWLWNVLYRTCADVEQVINSTIDHRVWYLKDPHMQRGQGVVVFETGNADQWVNVCYDRESKTWIRALVLACLFLPTLTNKEHDGGRSNGC